MGCCGNQPNLSLPSCPVTGARADVADNLPEGALRKEEEKADLPCRVLVLGIETHGRWSEWTPMFLKVLAEAKER